MDATETGASEGAEEVALSSGYTLSDCNTREAPDDARSSRLPNSCASCTEDAILVGFMFSGTCDTNVSRHRARSKLFHA